MIKTNQPPRNPGRFSVLVTGASGYVGWELCCRLSHRHIPVRAAVRSVGSVPTACSSDTVAVGDIGSRTDWSVALIGVDCIIHCAARAHVMHEAGQGALALYREVNVAGTQRLAEQAVARGVRRLVYLSSIKVNGEYTVPGAPFLCSDAPAPEDPYGLSKWEAEQVLWEVSARSGLEVVVVRSPLVYGPRVKGRLLRLLHLVANGVPLPLGAVQNQRSMMGLSNLVDLLLQCADDPRATGQTFLTSDGQDLSTPHLIRLMAEGMGRPARLLTLPERLLRVGGSVLGKRGEIERLLGTLQVDSSFTRERLNFTASVTVEDGVREMAKWYLSSHRAPT